MEDYPSNSKSPVGKTPEKRADKVVEGTVVRRKKPLGKRFAETFVQGDGESVISYVFWEVLTPALKDTVADMVTQGVERSLFGEARSSRGRSRGGPSHGPAGYISYNRKSAHPAMRDPEPRRMSRRGRASHDFGEIVLETRGEAEHVIDRLYDLVSQYDVATVSDLYDLVGLESDYTDAKWGWLSLEGTSVVRARGGGYLIDLPNPGPID